MKWKNHIERTLIIIKPDAVQRALVGDIFSRFERVGLKVVASKFMVPKSEQIERHYLANPEWKKEVGEKSWRGDPPANEIEYEQKGEKVLLMLKRFMCAGPVFAVVFEGAHSIALTRKLVGDTQPLTSDVGTIRGDYVMDSYPMADDDARAIRNLIHASSSKEDAEQEIDVWFEKDEIINYTTAQERILYDPNFDADIS